MTAATLLVHALVPCCRHHEHGSTGREQAECCDSIATGCCHDDHTESRHDDPPPAPCDCKLHCKALCVSLPPEKTLVDAGHSAPCVDILAFDSNTRSYHLTASAVYREGPRTRFALGPPLRLHLLYQSILL